MIVLTILYKAVQAITQLLAFTAKIAYHICRFLRIRLLVLYLLVCALCQLFFQPFQGSAIAIFWVGFATCVAFTLLIWGAFIRERILRVGAKRRVKEKKPPKSEEKGKREEEQPSVPEWQEKPSYPLYFDVEGREGYMFAEYADRYELYQYQSGRWVYLKTDYKQRIS